MCSLWVPHRSIVSVALLWLSGLLNSTSEHMLIFVNLVLMKDKRKKRGRSCNRKWGFALSWNDRKSKAQTKEGGLPECRASSAHWEKERLRHHYHGISLGFCVCHCGSSYSHLKMINGNLHTAAYIILYLFPCTHIWRQGAWLSQLASKSFKSHNYLSTK